VRGNHAPALAIGLIGKAPLPAGLLERIDAASQALRQAAEDSLDALIHAASEVWPRLGITAGRRHWHQASRTFGAIAQQAAIRSRGREDEFVAELERRLSEQRSAAFFDLDVEVGPIQLMNFHQTKGREADVVILVYRDNDWFGNEAEPFLRNSRLLYVALTRARMRDVVVLPPNPHPLVVPFAELALAQSA
jgi:DNA helicase-2/ATP-dependent DNA helicase PcrA